MAEEVGAMHQRYPQYYKDVTKFQWIDTYRVNHLFNVTDPAIAHAVKKLLLLGVRTGGKSVEKDVKEAYDTLGRYLAMRKEEETDELADMVAVNARFGTVVAKHVQINDNGFVTGFKLDPAEAAVAQGIDMVLHPKHEQIGKVEVHFCKLPPKGWHCKLVAGHAGPCPTWPNAEFELDIAQCRVEAFGVKIPYTIRITHYPTGLMAECNSERNDTMNRKRAFDTLTELVRKHLESKHGS